MLCKIFVLLGYLIGAAWEKFALVSQIYKYHCWNSQTILYDATQVQGKFLWQKDDNTKIYFNVILWWWYKSWIMENIPANREWGILESSCLSCCLSCHIYTYKWTNCTNKLQNACIRVNNYIFITTTLINYNWVLSD